MGRTVHRKIDAFNDIYLAHFNTYLLCPGFAFVARSPMHAVCRAIASPDRLAANRPFPF